MVTSLSRYGDINEKETYTGFEFQVEGTGWMDITEGNYIFAV